MRKQDQKPELLAPAGDFDKLRFAFAYGADAVYAGLPMFSLRTRENRFDLEAVKRGIDYAHNLGKKIYITANIYAHNVKIEPFLEAMEQVVPLGADAYIMSDPGLIDLIKERHPEAQVHLSTQANNTNWAQARFWKKIGVSRIILARELSFTEVTEISTKNPDMETEMFVHGALCMSYSGRCLLSDYFTGRPSNSGACTQSCRWEYRVKGSGVQEAFLEESKRPGKLVPVEEDEHGSYIFNSKDLCTVEYMPEILATGINSVKIEGRNKNYLYLATVIRTYRQAIDACFDGSFGVKVSEFIAELSSIDQRGYTHGFLHGRLNDMMNYDKTNSVSHAFGARIVNFLPDHLLEVELKHKLSVGDEVEWVTTDGILKQTITRILNSWDQEVQTLSPGLVGPNPKIYSELPLNEFSIMRVRER